MESFGSKHDLDAASEREPFNVEKGIEHERTILERFRGKAKDIARVMLFVSALTAGSFMHKETRAAEENTRPRIQSEQIQPKQNFEQSNILLLRAIEKRYEIVLERTGQLSSILLIIKESGKDRDYQERVFDARSRLSKAWDEITDVTKGIREFRKILEKIEGGRINLYEPLGQEILKNIKIANDTLDLLEKDIRDIALDSDLYIKGPTE